MRQLALDPDHTRALARDLRQSAHDLDLTSRPARDLAAGSSGPTASLTAALATALAAVERRSTALAGRLATLSTDAEAFVNSATRSDQLLASQWEDSL